MTQFTLARLLAWLPKAGLSGEDCGAHPENARRRAVQINGFHHPGDN
ncbi:MAG: hypothetical protein ACI81A_002647 [Paraglaciecola sp.]|jgi:hypothetical protein